MAARNRTWTPEVVRQKIRTSMLINRLQNHVAGRLEMSKTQIQAAGILLRKTLPDMIAQTMERRPLEAMADAELIDTLHAIRGYLALTSTGAGVADAREPATTVTVPTVQ
jgi:hypothetical protein